MPEKQKKLHKLSRFYARLIKRAKKRRAMVVTFRYRKKRSAVIRKLRHNRDVIALRKKSKGFVWRDGRMICGWINVELNKAHAYGWRGVIVSGYRTPAYSESLCYAMCGRLVLHAPVAVQDGIRIMLAARSTR